MPFYIAAQFNQVVAAHQRTTSAGYNPHSFATPARQEPLRPGRDEEEAFHSQASPAQQDDFDIYADFNNAGPRFASALSTPASFSSADTKG